MNIVHTVPAVKPLGKGGRKFYFPYLDSIRGVAIIMVVIFHTFSFGAKSADQTVFNRFVGAGSLGVPLFFVLSGFLISFIVINAPDQFAWKTYALRRFAKIGPPFLLSLVIFTIILVHRGTLPGGFSTILANLATLPNFMPRYTVINPVSWSLFVEIHFYLFLPLAYFCWRKLAPRHAEVLTVASLLVPATCCRIYSWCEPLASQSERFFLLYRFPNGMDYFAFGMVFAIVFRRYHEKLAANATGARLAILGVVMLMISILLVGIFTSLANVDYLIENAIYYEIVRLLICIAALLLLCAAAIQEGQPGSRLFGNKFLIYTGLISYEWFLFHPAIIPWLRFHFCELAHLPVNLQNSDGLISFSGGLAFAISGILCVLVTYLVAALIYEVFSRPLMKKMRP